MIVAIIILFLIITLFVGVISYEIGKKAERVEPTPTPTTTPTEGKSKGMSDAEYKRLTILQNIDNYGTSKPQKDVI